MKTIKQVLDYHFRDTKFDKQFVKKVDDFIIHFLSKNEYHIDFFGSNLIGVHPVRWNYSDSDIWWDEIFEVIPEYLQKDLHSLPSVNPKFNVSSDILNHAIFYSIHRIHHTTYLDAAEKERVKTRLMVCLNIKYLCSLLAHRFRYPADRGIAEKTFNSLSKRFDLKTTGSWGKMINSRSVNFVAVGGRYYKTYVEYTDEVDIIKMINDSQGRIRDTINEITTLYHQIKDAELKILLSSSQTNIDGTIILKDLQRKHTAYIRYIKGVISDGNSYLKEELRGVIYRAVPSLEEGVYEKLQDTFIKEYHNPKYTKFFDRLIENLLVYSFGVIKDNNMQENDFAGVLYRLKHIYMSGRVTDDKLLKAREDFIKVVEVFDKKIKNTPLVPERCAFFLYIVLRTLTMNYYK